MLDPIEKSFKKSVCQEKESQEKWRAVVRTVPCEKYGVNSIFFFYMRSLEGFIVFPDKYKRHSMALCVSMNLKVWSL